MGLEPKGDRRPRSKQPQRQRDFVPPQYADGTTLIFAISIVQTAYEREASAGITLHDKGLKVLKTKCHDGAGERFLCEVMFVSNCDPTERLYFDIVAVARTRGGWELKSGLCKR